MALSVGLVLGLAPQVEVVMFDCVLGSELVLVLGLLDVGLGLCRLLCLGLMFDLVVSIGCGSRFVVVFDLGPSFLVLVLFLVLCHGLVLDVFSFLVVFFVCGWS